VEREQPAEQSVERESLPSTNPISPARVRFGNNQEGAVNRTEYIGKIPGIFYDQFGNPRRSAILQDVSYGTSNEFNLISLTRLESLGWTQVGERDRIVCHSPTGEEIIFDIKIPTKKGCVFAVCFERQSEVSAVHADGHEEIVPRRGSVNQWHAKFGHCSEALTRRMAQTLGFVVNRGVMRAYAACGMGQSKPFPKSTETVLPGVGQRLHADINTIRVKHGTLSFARPNWFLLVDAVTGMNFSNFWNPKIALDSLVLMPVNGVEKTRFEHWYGGLPKFVEHLRTWGEAGVVKIRTLTTRKEENRGVPCVFVGYSNHQSRLIVVQPRNLHEEMSQLGHHARQATFQSQLSSHCWIFEGRHTHSTHLVVSRVAKKEQTCAGPIEPQSTEQRETHKHATELPSYVQPEPVSASAAHTR
jgi:hypothetical protein